MKELLRRWAPSIVAAIIIAFGLQWFVARPFEIPSPSMQPTIEIGDRVMVNRLSYSFGEIERGQVIVFDTPPGADSNEDFFIKRVIALPGEKIQLRDGNVYVGQQRVVEPYVAEGVTTRQRPRPIQGCLDATASSTVCTVPVGHVFVMGDNRGRSIDSRSFGPVSIDSVIGRAVMRVWPITELARV